MSDNIFKIGIGIFTVGLIAGILFSVGFNSETPTSKDGLAIMVLDEFCTSIQDINNEISFNCKSYVGILSISSIIMAILSVIVTSASIGHWSYGLIIYGIGWFIGLVFGGVNI